MIYLAHRGYWLLPDEKNRRSAFERAWEYSFGLEIDVRDAAQQLVISHDIPSETEMTLDDFLLIYHKSGNESWLALNIKSDGLALLLKESVSRYSVKNFFVFDMSTPELLNYHRHGLPSAVRMSEFEHETVLLEKSAYIWLDSFQQMWFDKTTLSSLLDIGKTVAIVSPELHQRNYVEDWNYLKKKGFHKHPRLMLCTDYPLEARSFFCG